jgi:hypothetical protein
MKIRYYIVVMALLLCTASSCRTPTGDSSNPTLNTNDFSNYVPWWANTNK